MSTGPSLKSRAVALLSRREYSRLTLARKLQAHSDDEAEVSRLLDDLTREGWLSDARFAQSVVHRRARTHGASRVAHDLRQSGIAEDAVATIRQTLRESEYDRAWEVWRKKFGSATPSVPERQVSAESRDAARQVYARQARFLASRGFGHDVIRQVLARSHQDDDTVDDDRYGDSDDS